MQIEIQSNTTQYLKRIEFQKKDHIYIYIV